MTDEARANASLAIAERVMAMLEELAAGDIVALYDAKGSEVDTARIDEACRARDLRVVYPRIVDGRRELAFHEASPHELERGHFGLREPRADAPRVSIDAIRAVVIPGLAFDRTGGRLGWGRGHYDATLAHAPNAIRIGVAFECQVVDHLPREPHDAAVHHVLTEAAHYTATL